MFHSARLKLTAWYLLIIMLISLSFSAVIHTLLTQEVERFAYTQRFRIERRFQERDLTPPPVPFFDPELLAETERRIDLILLSVNGVILIVSGGLGYFLAGRTLRPIQEMVNEQNQFVSDASHELRTPLTALKSSMEVYLRDKNSGKKEARNLISGSLREVDKLKELSDGLLKSAQYQKPGSQLKMERVDMATLTQEAVNKIKPLADRKNIAISNNPVSGTLEGSKLSLEELLVIILDNAIKYSPENSRINLKVGKNDGYLTISVSDQGVGIDKKDLPHIFDRFYRADSTRSKETAAGYGLGLSIAKQITDLHHGSISINSQINRGSTFTVRLPLKQSGQASGASEFKQIFSFIK